MLYLKKTPQVFSGSVPSMEASKAGAHLPSQGNPDDLRDAALDALQWEPLEGVVYQMNLHPNTPPWYSFTVFVRGSLIAVSPVGEWGALSGMPSVISREEWLEKMQTRRIRRKP